MNRAPEDLKVLAGEYVLGTLDAAERGEAETLLQQSPEFRGEVHWWERRFAALGLRLAPVAPPPVVWLGLQRRIEAAAPTPLRPRAGAGRFATTWAWMATAASLALGVALLLQLERPPPAPQVVTERVEVPVPAVSYVALLQMPNSNMQWSVSATPDRSQLVVRAAGDPPPAAAGHDPELWLITDAGPVSLGVIPTRGEARRAWPQGLALSGGRTLAVSLEPPGGSTTGQPTGPVVTTAAVLQAG